MILFPHFPQAICNSQLVEPPPSPHEVFLAGMCRTSLEPSPYFRPDRNLDILFQIRLKLLLVALV